MCVLVRNRTVVKYFIVLTDLYSALAIITIPENNAKNSAPQSVNYCVTDFRRTPVRLQICSLQFALCSTAFFALFSGLAIGLIMQRVHCQYNFSEVIADNRSAGLSKK